VLAEFKGNAQAANTKYDAKRTMITGKLVLEVPDGEEDPLIYFQGDANLKICCLSWVTKEPQFSKLKPEQCYAVEGVIQPYKGGDTVKLTNCVLIGTARKRT
jgi:hypothetical protein